MAFAMSEELLMALAPIIAYWIGALIYEVALWPMEQYRLFTKEEETQNLVTRRQALVVVLINQAIQMGGATLMSMAFLYKHIHSMHHRLIAPYSYGALYTHPVDTFVGEMVGALMATHVSGMSPRMAGVFISLLSLKSLDDHCGMWFPNHPIHRWMTNNTAFHILHHQNVGIKYNYSIFYFATWDRLLGTYLPFSVEPRKDGGYQLRTAKDE